jgi:hypothetical protein
MSFFRRGLLIAWVIFTASLASGQQQQQQVGLGETSRIEFEVRRWRATLESELQVRGNEPISPTEDLGVSDIKDNEFRGFVRFGRWVKVRGSYVRFKYQGTKTLEQDINFLDVTFPQGTQVVTSMQFEHLYAGAEIDILLLKEGLLAVLVDWTRTDVKPILSGNGAEANADLLRVQLLTLGLKGRVYLTRALALSAEFSGMKRGNVITDMEADATLNMSANVAVSVGYRNLYTKWVNPNLNERASATWKIKGYFFSGTVRF